MEHLKVTLSLNQHRPDNQSQRAQNFQNTVYECGIDGCGVDECETDGSGVDECGVMDLELMDLYSCSCVHFLSKEEERRNIRKKTARVVSSTLVPVLL